MKPDTAKSYSDEQLNANKLYLFAALTLSKVDIKDRLVCFLPFFSFLMFSLLPLIVIIGPGSGIEAGSGEVVESTGIMIEVEGRDLPHPDTT